jgi:hypothetical protein
MGSKGLAQWSRNTRRGGGIGVFAGFGSRLNALHKPLRTSHRDAEFRGITCALLLENAYDSGETTLYLRTDCRQLSSKAPLKRNQLSLLYSSL